MLTKPEAGVTINSVTKELAELEAAYKVRRKTLRALLAVLKAEAGETESDEHGE